MPDYSYSKIYKIWSPRTDKIYIGSTAQKHLSTRWAIHNYAYRQNLAFNSSVREIFEVGGARIKLIENYPCSCSMELRMRENHYIQTLPNVINKNRAYISKEDRKEEQKNMQYLRYITDPEYREYKKQYYIKNRDKIKQYYRDNKEKMREYAIQWRKNQKEKMQDYVKTQMQAKREQNEKVIENEKVEE